MRVGVTIAALVAALSIAAPSWAQGVDAGAPAATAPAAPGPTPEVRFQVRVEPPEVKLGDEVHYRVRFRAPRGVRVYFPEIPNVAPFQVVPGGRQETRSEDGGDAVVDVDLTLRIYRLGLQKIPPIDVPILGVEGETASVVLPKQRVRVLSRLAAEAEPELAPPGEPVPVIATNWTLVWALVVLGSVLVAAALTVFVMWLLRGRERAAAPPPPPRPAREIALGKLAAVERERLPEKGELMVYYVRISEAVREYFGNRYDFDGLMTTTFEMLQILAGRDLGELPAARTREFLEECDLVKFASFDPSPKEIDWLLSTAYDIVRKTMKEEKPAEAAPLPQTPQIHAARPFRRAFAWLVDLAIAALPCGGLLALARVLEVPALYGVAGGVLALWLLLRDLPPPGSLGKALAGLRLEADEEGPNGATTAGARVQRNLPHLMPFVGQTVELVVMAYDEDARRLGDRLAGTRVIDRRPGRGDAGALVGALVALAVAATLLVVVPFVWQ